MIARTLAALVLAASSTFAGACSRSAPARQSEPLPAPSGGGTASGGAPEGAAPTATATAPAPREAPAPVVAPSAGESTGSTPGEGGGGGNAGEARSGTANPFDEHGRNAENSANGVECQSDHDCACGLDRASGACAFGPVARIDTTRQCPDFCGGISGAMRVACDRGRCVQR